MPNVNPVAFTIFGLSVNWYGIIIAAATFLAIILSSKEAKRVGVNPDNIIDLSLLCIPLAIVFARIYYIVFEWNTFYTGNFTEFLKNAVNIRAGGIAIYGAIIGGLLAVFIYCKWKKLSFWKIVDIIIPSLILAQGLGRWGNFFNQEAYGNIITNPSWQFFPAAVFIPATGNWHMATFFYESIWCILAFFALSLYQRKSKNDGNVFALYLVVYGFERMIVEGFRMDSLWWGPFRVSQVLSGVMLVCGGAYLVYEYMKRKKLPAEALTMGDTGEKAAAAVTKETEEEIIEADEGNEPTEIIEEGTAAKAQEALADETAADDDDIISETGENLWAQDAEAYVYDETKIKAELDAAKNNSGDTEPAAE